MFPAVDLPNPADKPSSLAPSFSVNCAPNVSLSFANTARPKLADNSASSAPSIPKNCLALKATASIPPVSRFSSNSSPLLRMGIPSTAWTPTVIVFCMRSAILPPVVLAPLIARASDTPRFSAAFTILRPSSSTVFTSVVPSLYVI